MKKGYYKHYKGGIYKVIGTAIHTEDEAKLVIYIDTKGNTWARPIDMWNEKVNGIVRFTKLSDREGLMQFRFHQLANENK